MLSSFSLGCASALVVKGEIISLTNSWKSASFPEMFISHSPVERHLGTTGWKTEDAFT